MLKSLCIDQVFNRKTYKLFKNPLNMIFKNRAPYDEEVIIDRTGHYVGWKIHLTVSKENQQVVLEWLADDENCMFPFKQGDHGGQTGKDFTIYVGDWNNLKRYAKRLQNKIGNLLGYPEGDALDTDIVINPCVAARFDTAFSSESFSPLGKNRGIPLSLKHFLPLAPSSEELKNNIALSLDDLVTEFGSFFGPKNEVSAFY